MKKIMMAAVALICMTATCSLFTSCTEEKTTIKGVEQLVTYRLDGIETLKYYSSYESTLTSFLNDLKKAMQSSVIRSDEEIINKISSIVDTYNNGGIMGTFSLQSSTDDSNWKTIKTYTMTESPLIKDRQ